MKNVFLFGIAAAMSLAATGPAGAAVTIDFSDQTASFSQSLGNQLVYPEATFSSAAGLRIFTFQGFIDKGLCPHATNACRASLTIDFTNPASNISFGVYQVDTTGLLTISGTTTSGTFSQQLILAHGFDANTVSLGGFTDVTSLTLDGTTDEEGYLYDNFSFDASPPGGVGGVPEPSTWLMMILGFGAIGASSRARRRLVST